MIMNLKELAKKIGISEQVVSAGDYKQTGTMMRKMSKKEEAALRENINDIYELFVNDVANARGLNATKKDEFANAKIFIEDLQEHCAKALRGKGRGWGDGGSFSRGGITQQEKEKGHFVRHVKC